MHDRLILGIAVVIGLGFLLAMALAKAAGRRNAQFDAEVFAAPTSFRQVPVTQPPDLGVVDVDEWRGHRP